MQRFKQPTSLYSMSLQSDFKVSSGVPPPPPPPPPPPMSSILTKSKPSIPAKQNKPSLHGGNDNAHLLLMGAIQKRGLKHVEQTDKSSASKLATGTEGSLAKVLEGALKDIIDANHRDSSDDDSTDVYEW